MTKSKTTKTDHCDKNDDLKCCEKQNNNHKCKEKCRPQPKKCIPCVPHPPRFPCFIDPAGPCVPSPDPTPPMPPTYTEMVEQLKQIERESCGLMRLEKAGESVQGRDLLYAVVGCGPTVFFAWGSIHGDEEVGVNALMQIIRWLLSPTILEAKAIRKRITAVLIPMWNPDGNTLGTRNGAPLLPQFPNGQDLNRDWTTEGIVGIPGSSNFVYPESRAWYNVYIKWRPDYILDIHQYTGVTTFPLTGEPVQFRIGTAHEIEHVSPEQFKQSLQMGQVALQTVEVFPCIKAANFMLSSEPGTPPRSALRRMIFDGKRFITGPSHVPKGGVFFEIRRVFPEFNYVIWQLVISAVQALILSIASNTLERIDKRPYENLPDPIVSECLLNVNQNSTQTVTSDKINEKKKCDTCDTAAYYKRKEQKTSNEQIKELQEKLENLKKFL